MSHIQIKSTAIIHSEIQAANPTMQYFDPVTKFDVAYWAVSGLDSHTGKGTWVSYNGVPNHAKPFTHYALDMGLRCLHF